MFEAILTGAVVTFLMNFLLGLVLGSSVMGLSLIIGILTAASCYFAFFEDRSYRRALDEHYKN